MARFATVLFLLLFATAVMAQSSLDGRFRNWLDTELWPQARAKGISRKTFDAAFDGVTPNLKLPDLVLPGQEKAQPKKQHQAEFRSPAAYFSEKTVGGVTQGGRSRQKSLARTLAAIERKYGVPGPVLLAIWGRESGFGAAKMPYDAFALLGTKAWLATRRDMFRAELIDALQLLEKGMATRKAMRSSWAGALGQPQFLPGSLLKHGVDFDGDGKIDIWGSQPDTLASIAKYLADYGWQKGRDWGFEVSVPDSVSCALEGPDQGKTFAQWAKLGVKRVSGKPFPSAELSREGFLLMPAGRNGPAFIVTPNFYVLKEYNESDLYALFIGHAADRIAHGDSRFSAGWGAVDQLFRSEIADMQKALERQGHDVGGADGLPGFKTRRSIGLWQQQNGQAPTCFPSKKLVQSVK